MYLFAGDATQPTIASDASHPGVLFYHLHSICQYMKLSYLFINIFIVRPLPPATESKLLTARVPVYRVHS